MQMIPDISDVKYSQVILESLCEDILNLDPKIKSVGMIDDKGKLLTENKRKGLESFMNKKDQEVLLMEMALGVRMRREHDAQLGPVNFTISYSENMVSLIFPFQRDMLYVSTDHEIDFSKISFLILQLLEQKLIKRINVV
jgi:hypothetical protein